MFYMQAIVYDKIQEGCRHRLGNMFWRQTLYALIPINYRFSLFNLLNPIKIVELVIKCIENVSHYFSKYLPRASWIVQFFSGAAYIFSHGLNCLEID